MITAKKSRVVRALLLFDTLRRMRRSFEAVRVTGLEEARALASRGPLLVVSNHTAWWDPLVALLVSERLLGADAYAMMDAKNLRKLPFFRGIGAFGVDLDDAPDGARAIRYAAKLLRGEKKLVWIFPQGEERPVSQVPLGFRGGSAEIARVAKSAKVLPVALRYEFGSDEKPSLYVSIGAAVDTPKDVAEARFAQEQAVAHELVRINDALVAKDTKAYVTVVSSQRGWLSRFLQASLAWLTGRPHRDTSLP